MSGAGHSSAPSREPPSESAIEGRAAHWVAHCVLKGDASCANDLIGRHSPDGHEVTADMTKYVQGYIDLVQGSIVEEQIIVPPHVRGRVDAARDLGDYLIVYEFKYGWRIVEPAYNPQLMLAAAGLIKPAHHTVALVVYQPRPFHPQGVKRVWTTSREVFDYHLAHILERAELAQGVNPSAKPGNHCDGCHKAASCRALAHTVFEVSERPGNAELPVEFLGREWQHLRRSCRLMTARLNALTAEIEARLNSGVYVPGAMYKDRNGHRRWSSDTRAIEAFTGMRLHKSVEITPAQAEKEGYNTEGLTNYTKGRELVPATVKEMEAIFNTDK